MLPGDSAFIRTWYELAESQRNLCTLISITALDCFLYYCLSPSLLVCTSDYCADWTAKWCPSFFPKCLPVVEMKRWVVGLYPWEGISQEKRPTEINVGKSLRLWQEYSFTDFLLLLKWTSIYWKNIWQDSALNQLNSNAGNTKYIFLCVWKSSNKKNKRTWLKSFTIQKD